MEPTALQIRIRELCSQAVSSGSSEQLEPVIAELKQALHEHTEYLRGLAEEKLVPSLVSHEMRERLANAVRTDAA
jgi:hypothetical protein